MNEQEQLAKSRAFYWRLLVIGLFAFALLHSINPFFFRFFFWISFGMGAMTLYYHFALKIAERGTQSQFRPQGQRAQWVPPQSSEPSTTPQVKKAIGIITVVVFFIFFLLLIIGILAGDDETAQTEDEVSRYNQARALYDSQDYRGAIKALWSYMNYDTPDTQSVLLMADSYYAVQSLDSAYIWYTEAYIRGERSAFLSHVMAYILDERGNSQEAIRFYKEAIEQDSTKADVYGRLAELEPDKRDWYLAKQREYADN